MRSNSVIGSGLCPRLKIRWVLSTVNSLIRRSAAIRLIVALNVWESGAPSAPQNTYGGLGQRPEATRRRKSKKGGLMALPRIKACVLRIYSVRPASGRILS